MKYLKKYNENSSYGDILDIVETFVDGLSVKCSFYLQDIGDGKYDAYINSSSNKISIDDFNHKKISLESRINYLNFGVVYKEPSYQLTIEGYPIEDISNLTNIMILIRIKKDNWLEDLRSEQDKFLKRYLEED